MIYDSEECLSAFWSTAAELQRHYEAYMESKDPGRFQPIQCQCFAPRSIAMLIARRFALWEVRRQMPKNEQVNQVLDLVTKPDLEYRTEVGKLLLDLICTNKELVRRVEHLEKSQGQLLDNLETTGSPLDSQEQEIMSMAEAVQETTHAPAVVTEKPAMPQFGMATTENRATEKVEMQRATAQVYASHQRAIQYPRDEKRCVGKNFCNLRKRELRGGRNVSRTTWQRQGRRFEYQSSQGIRPHLGKPGVWHRQPWRLRQHEPV